jgi:uncharacterized protein
MNRVTFDTNIWISSTLWENSVSRKLLNRLILESKEIFLTKEILEEYLTILKRDFNLSREEFEEKAEIILSFAKIVEPSVKVDFVKEDPDDNKIIECAVESKSEYILSYDKHLLKLKEYQGIKIARPEEAFGLIFSSSVD